MQNDPVLKIDLCIRDKVIKTYNFTQDTIDIGRIPTADIFIDNSGISREHTRIERSIGGPYIVKDMGSTNGTFLNDRKVNEAALSDNDVISLGKFTLKVSIKSKEGSSKKKAKVSKEDFDGTTVLSSSQLEKLQANLRQVDPDDPDYGVAATKTPPPAAPAVSSKDSEMPLSRILFWGGLLILLGVVIGLLVAK